MEEWKDIIGYEDFYQISNLGRVKSLSRKAFVGNKNVVLQEKIKSPAKSKVKHLTYYRTGLWKEGKVKFFSIHRLIAIHFIPNPLNLPYINHIDCNGENNSISNLEWCNQSHNIKHYFKTKKSNE